MFSDMSGVATAELADQLLAAPTSAISELLGDGSYVGWLAIDATGQVIAGAGAHVTTPLPPIFHGGQQITAGSVTLVVNVYTHPDWRRQGIARALMMKLLEWVSTRGCDRVVLHASDEGRSLYTSLGFEPTNEMRWTPTSGDRRQYT